ncbi:MAG: MFS transporter [Flavobacteriales bacterium]|nr:MFS transporter [Flavobacteriales bacterium]MBT3962608.1 MFS transporter [Flavobacteriales bacterium]MBT4705996.1 MFS transporter [Flavobacteriales bacterium]MBT4931482.1 MFS transporter [Flavobacteriales bacterium]MBT5131594.1 MFS transporter [Flavobacteriales bacterium]
MKVPKRILPVIVLSQFCCTSLWFAGNGVMNDLVSNFQLAESALGHLTSAVQFGFISGTLLFAILTIADRFSPSKVFVISALAGALFNTGMMWEGNSLGSLLIFRFLTGFFLAGIYPVGMKIAADYYDKKLGKSLGLLVGALVIGTAFPHLIKGLTSTLHWKIVLWSTSSLAFVGGLLMFTLVPNGPYRKPGQKLDLSAFFKVFENRDFRSAAFGYFGHMWELYAFWAFVPVILTTYADVHPESIPNVPFLSFSIIGIGGIACVIGGYVSLKAGAKKTAAVALLLSCLCCVASPLMLGSDSIIIIVAFLLFWGMVVVADSPLFSTLVARNAPAESKGTALTIVNCIGFSITIISIQILVALKDFINPTYLFLILALGPFLGLMALYRK